MADSDSDDRTAHEARLAEERTRLARERTILAHIRTGFASLLFGTGIFGLFGTVVSDVLGGLFVFLGVLFLATGWLSYVRSNRRVQHLVEEAEKPFQE